jgi:hypothetical protein
MSSLAYPQEAAPTRAARRSLTDIVAAWGSDVLLGVALLALAAILLAGLPGDFNVDSWLALVTGREVFIGGIPHHEVLTVMSQGAPWIDQQWLSQFASYAIYLVGGFGLLGLVNILLLVSGIAGATVAARRLGAPFRSVLLTLPLCVAVIMPSREVRTQEFAIPLFVALVYLLTRDSRAPSRRVFWCLPILVVWANLHGTVTLGAALVGLRGLTVLWERRRSLTSSLEQWRRPLALIVGAGASILITPYGVGIIGYYRTTMLSSTLRHFVTEWQPITSSTVTAVFFFIVAGAAVWSFGRHASKTTLWERLAFLVLAAGSIEVVRNTLFFGLFALMIVPVSIAFGQRRAGAVNAPPDRRRGRVNGLLGATAVAVLALVAVATLVRPDSTIEYGFQRVKLLAAVEQVTRADPSIKILPDERFGDWLLWRDPALSGRISNDVRFELLSSSQLISLESVFSVVGPNWKAGARGYRLLVLDKRYDPNSVKAFLEEPGHRVLYNDGQRIVILRSAHEAELS